MGMLNNSFLSSVSKILVIGAHNDDIEFLAGGTLARIAADRHLSHIQLGVTTMCSREKNTGEPFSETIKNQSKSFDHLGLHLKYLANHEIRSRFLPEHRDEVRGLLSAAKKEFQPDLIISHFLDDPNQDHSALAEEVYRVFRGNTVLGGEIPNTSFKFSPTLFIGIEKTHVDKKVRAVSQYVWESSKNYFDPELIAGLARVRGGQSNRDPYSEAFEIYHLVS